jgi:hypothetical protein
MQAPRPEWPSTIRQFEPRDVVVGQPVTIIGAGFGAERGVGACRGELEQKDELTTTINLPCRRRPALGRRTTSVRPQPARIADCEVGQAARRSLGRWASDRGATHLETPTPSVAAVTPGEATPAAADRGHFRRSRDVRAGRSS